jgi:transposase-like protein
MFEMADACLGLDVQWPFGYLLMGGLWLGAKKDKSGWSTFPHHLVDRGLKGRAAGHFRRLQGGPCRERREFLPEVRYQRCKVHFYRNVATSLDRQRLVVRDRIRAAEDLCTAR